MHGLNVYGPDGALRFDSESPDKWVIDQAFSVFLWHGRDMDTGAEYDMRVYDGSIGATGYSVTVPGFNPATHYISVFGPHISYYPEVVGTYSPTNFMLGPASILPYATIYFRVGYIFIVPFSAFPFDSPGEVFILTMRAI